MTSVQKILSKLYKLDPQDDYNFQCDQISDVQYRISGVTYHKGKPYGAAYIIVFEESSNLSFDQIVEEAYQYFVDSYNKLVDKTDKL